MPKRKLTEEDADALAKKIDSDLTKDIGENWKKDFKNNKKNFPKPVIAHMYFSAKNDELKRLSTINMLIKKIHENNAKKIKKYLDCINATQKEINDALNKFESNIEPNKFKNIKKLMAA